MSWASLTSNQIVSTANLADAVETGVFAAKQYIPTTIPSLALTTANAIAFAYVNVDPSFASNRLVTKASLSATNVGPGPYNYYVYGVDGSSMFQSINGGFTFASYTALPYQGPGVYTVVAASSTGQYLITASDSINNTLYISTNYGSTFNTVNISNVGSGYTFNSFYPINADVSSSGQYIVVVGKTQPQSTLGQVTVAVSSDYGTTFTAYYGAYQTITASRASVAISQNGNLIIYVAASTTSNNSWRYTSTNYGSSFTYGGLSTNQIFTDVSTSSTGQYILIVNKGTASTGNFFVSSNSGGSYTSRSTAGGGEWCGMSSNGQFMEVGTYATTFSSVGGGAQYISYNNGVDWSPNGPIFFAKGMAVGNVGGSPSLLQSNYWVVFGSLSNFVSNTSCLYIPPGYLANVFYDNPLTYGFTLNKFYRKAIAY
jgi:hypothetical protein